MRIPHCAATVIFFGSKSDQQQKSLEQERRNLICAPFAVEREGRLAVTATQEQLQFSPEMASMLSEIGRQALVHLASEAEADLGRRQQAAEFIGSCLTQTEVDIPVAGEAQKLVPIESLLDGIRWAAWGDKRGRKLVKMNVSTDVIERTTKAGHIMKVNLDTDAAGRIQQHGQSMESVQANSLRYASDSPQMLARTKAETINSFRIADYYRQGELDDYYFVVLSRAADDMDETAMTKAGFFVDTMSVAIQATTATGSELTTESAFVAGKARPRAGRHDAATIAAMGNKLGVNLMGMTATELLGTPLMIHKSLMPNGVVDLVALYDKCAGGTFFGEAKPQQDYQQYAELCRRRDAEFQPIVEAITNQLIAEVASLNSRIDAVQRLAQLSQDHMVRRSVVDLSINPKVFGPGAIYIEQARHFMAIGDLERASQNIKLAERESTSSSCPTGLNAAGENREGSGGSDDDDCEFTSKECPKCHKKNVKTTVSKGVISGDCGCKAKIKTQSSFALAA